MPFDVYWRGRDQGRKACAKSKNAQKKLNPDRGKITPIKYLLSIELKDCGGDNLRKQLLPAVVSPPIC